MLFAMTFFRTFEKTSSNLLCFKKCVICTKNGWNAELYFGSKVEVPSPPKRPLTAYMLFCKENRKNILKENPSLSSPEQIKILAERWGQLTKDMKKPFEVNARESTLLYGELHKKFYENLTEEQKEELARLKTEKKESRRLLKLKRALRDSGMPKYPAPAYARFVQSEAKNWPTAESWSNFIKNAAETWKNLSEETKKVFEEQYQAEKKRYAIELCEWQSKMQSEGRTDLIKAVLDMKGGKGKPILNQSVKESTSEKMSASKS